MIALKTQACGITNLGRARLKIASRYRRDKSGFKVTCASQQRPFFTKDSTRTRLQILSTQRTEIILSATNVEIKSQNSSIYSAEFVKVRAGVFLSILLGYSCYYLTRNSLTFTAPAMVATPNLGLDITSIGVITSIFPICYGCSKFVSGVVGDMLSPAIMLGGGLMATGVVCHGVKIYPVQFLRVCFQVNIAFGASSTLPLFCILWAMNGILQGFGAPSCAKILTSWFAAQERGTYWVRIKILISILLKFLLQGMWNIAHNLGGFAAPILAGTAARTFGWSVSSSSLVFVFLTKLPANSLDCGLLVS